MRYTRYQDEVQTVQRLLLCTLNSWMATFLVVFIVIVIAATLTVGRSGLVLGWVEIFKFTRVVNFGTLWNVKFWSWR